MGGRRLTDRDERRYVRRRPAIGITVGPVLEPRVRDLRHRNRRDEKSDGEIWEAIVEIPHEGSIFWGTDRAAAGSSGAGLTMAISDNKESMTSMK